MSTQSNPPTMGAASAGLVPEDCHTVQKCSLGVRRCWSLSRAIGGSRYSMPGPVKRLVVASWASARPSSRALPFVISSLASRFAI